MIEGCCLVTTPVLCVPQRLQSVLLGGYVMTYIGPPDLFSFNQHPLKLEYKPTHADMPWNLMETTLLSSLAKCVWCIGKSSAADFFCKCTKKSLNKLNTVTV